MFYYDFDIAGLLLRVRSQFALTDFFELSHFISEYRPNRAPDAEYTLQLLPNDWKVRGERILADRQNAVYQWQGEEHRYYYWNIFSEERFILLRYKLDDPGNCSIYLQPEDLNRILPQFRLAAFLSPERLLLHFDAFLLHSSLIDWQGNGILFTAPSGTGKSTQAELWHQLEGAQILNGDRAIIRQLQDGFKAYGSPYAGSSGIFTKHSTPIRAVVVLSQAPENSLERLSPVDAFNQLYRQSTVLSWDPQFVDRISECLLDLIEMIPVYHLACRPDAGAVAALKAKLI